MDEEFDGLQYIASYGDLIQAFGENTAAGENHYERSGRAERRQTDAFDEAQYLANYPDLQQAFGTDGALATLHYIRFGYGEGRNDDPPPPPGFDPLQYIASHADLIDAFGLSPELGLRHYQLHGRVEGRATDTFDEVQYLANYPDLAPFNGDPGAATIHYILFGKNENRNDDEAGNTPPAPVDDTLEVSEDDGGTPVDVLVNDDDLDGDPLAVVGVSAAARGFVSLASDGTVTYDPGDAFVGLAEGEPDTDSFRYTVADDGGGLGTGTVAVTVTGANDAPAFTSDAAPTVTENTRAVVTLAATDPEEDPVTFTKTGGADEALFVIENGNELVFTEAAPDYVETEDNEYLVRVTARDNAGGETPQDLTVSIEPVPVFTPTELPEDPGILPPDTGVAPTVAALDFLI